MTTEAVELTSDPVAAVRAVQEIVASASATQAPPAIALPPSGQVTLPGGFAPDPMVPTEIEYRATVKELTGEDEEEITRARRGTSDKFWSTVLARGTQTLGDAPATPDLLRRLLVGDRDTLLMEISRATYGDQVEYPGITCPHCQEMLDVVVSLDDIPMKTLDDPNDRTFEVTLRKGGTAQVRLPVGADQEQMMKAGDTLTTAEVNTLFLSRCVISLTDTNGGVHGVAGMPGPVKALGMTDRNKILNEIALRQPGPQFDQVKFTHETCEKEVYIPVGAGDLFPGL